jgi:hypothetical protein
MSCLCPLSSPSLRLHAPLFAQEGFTSESRSEGATGHGLKMENAQVSPEPLLTNSTFFLIAGIQYTYITYLGYNALPFVARSELLLAPLLPLFTG